MKKIKDWPRWAKFVLFFITVVPMMVVCIVWLISIKVSKKKYNQMAAIAAQQKFAAKYHYEPADINEPKEEYDKKMQEYKEMTKEKYNALEQADIDDVVNRFSNVFRDM